MTAEAQQPVKIISIRILLLAGLIIQILSIVPLWGHESESTAILGRYSGRYAIILGFHAIIIVLWVLLAIRRSWVENALRRLSVYVIYGIPLATGLALAGLWVTSVEEIIKQYLSLTWLVIVLILVRSLPDRPVKFQWWPSAFVLLCLLLLLPMYIGVLADRHFEPDEAFWANLSESAFSVGGLYSTTTYLPEVPITPGMGWMNAGYGWLLHNVTFDISVGRTWQFCAYLIAFAGIGAVAARLYGWKIALVAVTIAILSQTFIPYTDYRPNRHIPAIATFTLFAVLQACHSRNQWIRGFWNIVCGLLATLSLQVHGSGVILAVAFSWLYLLEFLWKSYRQRRLADMRPLMTFGLGALAGTLIFYQFNLQPVGGLGPYLQRLQTERGTFTGLLPSWQRLLTWPGLAERFLVWSGALYLLWRRSLADKRFISMLALIMLASALFDTQGYLHPYNAFFMIAIAVLLVDGFGAISQPRGQNRHSALATAAVIVVFALQMWGSLLSNPSIWQWFRTGQLPPFLYKEIVPILAPYIRPDDTIVSTHQLIWSFPQASLISHAAAGHHIFGKIAAKNGPFQDEIAFWEDVNPSLIIYIENEMHFDPGLQEYMSIHGFQVCNETELMDHDIRLYRTTCL